MTNIIFSFDTEDFVNPIGAEGILRSAKILEEENVRGNFVTVGKLAQALEAWGRTDVIKALKYHEIGLHSLGHTYHPTINEYTDLEDYGAALANFLQHETENKAILTRIFGQKDFSCGCPPGNSTSYVAHYGYEELGATVYAGDEVFDKKAGRPLSFCNVQCLEYPACMEFLIPYWGEQEYKDRLDTMANYDTYILSHHPQTAFVKENQFWDALNFQGKNTDPENYVFSDPQPTEFTEKYYAGFRKLVRMIKADPRFRIVTYSDIAHEHSYARELRRELLPAVAAQINDKLFPVTLPESLSLCDIMLACRDFLFGAEIFRPGKSYGFLDTPFAITEPVTVTKAEITDSALQLRQGQFLPLSIDVGGKKLGPADWMRAALAILCGADEVTVQPGEWQIDMDQFPMLKDLSYKGTWMHADSFEDNYLSKRYKLQTWTMRLPRGSARLIY